MGDCVRVCGDENSADCVPFKTTAGIASRHGVFASRDRYTILLRGPKGFHKGDIPSLGAVARWLTDLGGYTGPSSGGPFGAKVLARGLDYIAPVVQLLSRRDDMING